MLITDEELGRFLFACRPLSTTERAKAAGFGWEVYCFLVPVIIIPFFSLWPVVGAIYLAVDFSIEIRRAVALVAFLLSYGTLYWLIYRWPRRDYLHVHERGFRFLLTYRKATVLYDRLQELVIGRNISSFEKGLWFVNGLTHPEWVTWAQGMADMSLTLRWRDGSTRVYKVFFTCFDMNDLTRFLEYLVSYAPNCSDSVDGNNHESITDHQNTLD